MTQVGADSERQIDEAPDDDVVEAIVSGLGLRTCIETEARTDDHAVDVVGFIADAAAHRARFEDTLDAS